MTQRGDRCILQDGLQGGATTGQEKQRIFGAAGLWAPLWIFVGPQQVREIEPVYFGVSQSLSDLLSRFIRWPSQ